jgi:chemotaxis signal transduction protein
MTAPVSFEQRLLGFRQAFDQAFAVAPFNKVETLEDLLAIRVAGDAYALRMRDISGLIASRKIVPVPSRRPELLGLAGNRGGIVTVYSLGALLGYDSGAASWLALARESVGLGFEQFEGFLRVRTGDIHATTSATRHTGHVVVVGSESRPVVDIPSMLAALDVAGSPKES